MKEILLLKDGEIVLKGLNRRSFEDAVSYTHLTLPTILLV